MKKLFSIIIFSFFVLGISIAQDEVGHEAIIEQTGQDNEAEIIQEFDRNWAEVIQMNDNNRVTIDQVYGSDNIAQIKQMGEQEHTYFRQDGNNNVFRLLQDGGVNKVGEDADNPFIQLGNKNEFAGVSGVDELFFESESYAIQRNGATLLGDSYQTGNENKIGLYQNGASEGSIRQFGDSNEALLYQHGDGHSADITQDGDGHRAEIKQTGPGSGNTVRVNQTNGF